jgi:hypothetical protein
MKLILKEAKEAYYELSSKASEVNRQIGFAGIAIIWIFCSLNNGFVRIPEGLILPSLLILFSLGFDLLQYVLGSIVWGCFHRQKEKSVKSDEDEVHASRFLNYPQNFFFVAKLIFMIIAYYNLISFLFSRLNKT